MGKYDEKIRAYCEKKEEEKVMKKEISKLSEEIKDYLANDKDADGESGEWVVSLQNRSDEDLDEDKLISILINEYGENSSFISYIPTVNMNELEGAIYRKEVSEDILNKIDGCRIKKSKPALVYKRKKGV